MKRILASVFLVVMVVSLVIVTFTVRQVNQEERSLTTDLQYRSTLLAESLKEAAEPYVISKSAYLQKLVDKFSDKERLAGVTVYDNKENVLALTPGLPKESTDSAKIAGISMDQDKASGDFSKVNNKSMYLFSIPLHDKDRVIGALVVAQNADYIDQRIYAIWKSNLLRLLVQVCLISVALVIAVRWIIFEPIKSVVESMKLARQGKLEQNPEKLSTHAIFQPVFKEVGSMGRSLLEARRIASEEARLRLEKLDSPWTTQRLREFVHETLKDKPIFVISNREPYVHEMNNGRVTYYQPAGGVVTAIEPVLSACGGTWIASGTGSADRKVVDGNDKMQVPPDDPRYTLKRVWLTEKEERGFYEGFSNEGLWPLCLLAHVRPVFRSEDWEQYTIVNGKFAKDLLSEIKNIQNPIVLVQDYHFALLPGMIKKARPDALVGIFWHIPWPNSESFNICPWRKEILDGLLGADLIGFQTQLYCNNFIDTVSRKLESLIDLEQYTVTRMAHTSHVKPFPISIPFVNKAEYQPETENLVDEKRMLREKLSIKTEYVGLGVDRLDYTKGIMERLKAVEFLFDTDERYKGKFTFIQIASPTRGNIVEYQQFSKRVADEVERINNKFKTNGWRPIVYLNRHHSHKEVYAYYRVCDVCLVTSLHDGMNLVAKEFVAARDDERGVLVLSQFAGACNDLRDALVVNPYNIEEVASAIRTGLEMPLSEKRKRMTKLREHVKNYNIFRWSAEFLKSLVSLE